MESTVRLGVSACLLGEAVRFDGGHKRDAFISDALSGFVDWVRVCPEQEAGFGTPREAMRLVTIDSAIRLVTVRTKRDVTAMLQDAAAARVADLTRLDLDGFVLKADSPSCGPARVRIYSPEGGAIRNGRGLFAAALAGALPDLPIESEGRLTDPAIREHFFARVFARRRWRALTASSPGVRALMRFHAQHKLLLMAHSPQWYAALGRLVASASRATMTARLEEYAAGFMAALARPATRARHVNVLQHIAGYFKEVIRDPARRELAAAVEEYRQALVPLVVPVSLLSHHARVYGVDYILDQAYLEPYPKALRLRNHV